MDNKKQKHKLKYCAKGSRKQGNAFINETKQLAKIVDCIEIDFNYPHDQNFEEEINFLIKLQRNKGIQYTVHAPYFDEGINSLNEKIRLAILEEVFYSIDMAKKLKSKIVVLHPALDPYGLKMKEREKPEMDSYKRISKYAESKDLLIGLENEAQTCFWFPDRACKFQELEKTVKLVGSKNFGYTMTLDMPTYQVKILLKRSIDSKTNYFIFTFTTTSAKKKYTDELMLIYHPEKE